MIELLSLLFLLTMFGLIFTLIFKGRKRAPANVLQFRAYHRIEWLRKRRLSKMKSRGKH